MALPVFSDFIAAMAIRRFDITGGGHKHRLRRWALGSIPLPEQVPNTNCDGYPAPHEVGRRPTWGKNKRPAEGVGLG